MLLLAGYLVLLRGIANQPMGPTNIVMHFVPELAQVPEQPACGKAVVCAWYCGVWLWG